ncbi:MAG: 2-oxo acid dehydrogenase subunit E2 [Synergistaceae bacterium]|nr:dihydrolipoamide acetyltransferase family protein [Synergistota bacterium]NLM71791.1 2-oxo acid dehydrogenase subunit E2 [Synergistaceae bacterium]
MASPVIMPKLGLTMNRGTVSRWGAGEGEPVRKGDLLMVVATDKLTFDVEAPEDGVLLKILVPEGGEAPVGAVIAYIGAEGEVPPDVAASPLPPSHEPVPSPAPAPVAVVPAGDFVRATPLARKIARERGLDLARIEGTGPGGRRLRRDVEAAARAKASPVAARMAADLGLDLASVRADGRVMKQDVIRAATERLPAGDVEVPLTPMRRVIAERMSLSSSTIPSVTYHVDADFTELSAARESLREEAARSGVKISFNHLLMKICAVALTEFPMANSSFGADSITMHGNVNIGLAVSVEGGLLVPNVKSAQDKGLLQIALETEELVRGAREGTLPLDSVQGGTFTLTNLGMFGTSGFTPLINPPEACILGLNAVVDRPVAIGGEVVVRPMTTLSLSADHRILDGAEAALFLARIRELVENPWLLLLK